jgi:hypothetical protein
MDWSARDRHQNPEDCSPATNASEVVNGENTYVKPTSPFAFPKVGLVYFVSCWRTQNLHSVIAKAEQQRAQRIDADVSDGVQAFHTVTTAFVKKNLAFAN